MNFYFGYVNAFLFGRGDASQANKVTVASKGIQILIGIILLKSGYGLIGLALSGLIATGLSRLLGVSYLAWHKVMPLGEENKTRDVQDLRKVLWHNASRYGLVILGAFMVSRATTFVATSRIGLVEASSFNLALQILLVLQSVASAPFNTVMPKLNAMRTHGMIEQMQLLFSRVLIGSIVLLVSTIIVLCTAGPIILKLIGSKISLPPRTQLILMGTVILLELNHGICANLITVNNQVPFVRAALLTGFGITVTAWYVVPKFGVLGIILTMLVWQICYNNWKWPIEASRMLKTTYRSLFLIALRR